MVAKTNRYGLAGRITEVKEMNTFCFRPSKKGTFLTSPQG